MFEYHGWITLRSAADAEDTDPPPRLPEIAAAVAEFAGYGLMDLRSLNGNWYLHLGGCPNRSGSWGPALIGLLHRIAELAPGSYGLLHVYDDEDVEYSTHFRVYRIARGAVSVSTDDLLSPVVPTIEDD